MRQAGSDYFLADVSKLVHRKSCSQHVQLAGSVRLLARDQFCYGPSCLGNLLDVNFSILVGIDDRVSVSSLNM